MRGLQSWAAAAQSVRAGQTAEQRGWWGFFCLSAETYTDDCAFRHQLPTPDLIKLDVQGFELEVLRGAEKSLAQTKAVLLEASFQNFYQGQCRFDELVSWLAAAGLHVRAFGHGTALGRPLVQSDVLFSRTY